jgi:hypothetical protein
MGVSCSTKCDSKRGWVIRTTTAYSIRVVHQKDNELHLWIWYNHEVSFIKYYSYLYSFPLHSTPKTESTTIASATIFVSLSFRNLSFSFGSSQKVFWNDWIDAKKMQQLEDC